MAFVATLVACDPPVVALHEAKKAAPAFESGYDAVPLELPPRTINDITAILNTDIRDGPKINRSFERLAESPPPASASPRIRVRYHYRRANAFRRLGKMHQAVAELDKAAVHIDKTGRRLHGWYLVLLARTQGAVKGPRTALRTGERSLDFLRSPSSRRLYQLTRMANWSLKTGQIKNAQEFLDRADDEIGRLRPNVSDTSEILMTAALRRARGRFHLYLGQLEEAERELNAAIKNLEIVRAPPETANWNLYRPSENWSKNLAHVFLAQGRTLEAEALIRKSLISTLRRSGRYGDGVARLTKSLSKILSTQGRPAEAETLARAAIDILENIGYKPSSRLIWKSRKRLARIIAAQEKVGRSVGRTRERRSGSFQ